MAGRGDGRAAQGGTRQPRVKRGGEKRVRHGLAGRCGVARRAGQRAVRLSGCRGMRKIGRGAPGPRSPCCTLEPHQKEINQQRQERPRYLSADQPDTKQITAQQEPGQPGSRRSSTPGRRRADRRFVAVSLVTWPHPCHRRHRRHRRHAPGCASPPSTLAEYARAASTGDLHFQLRTSIFLTASFHSRPLSF